jgi:hypothetical protein
MLVEMNELKRSVKVASMSADKALASKQKAAMKASALFDKLHVSTCLINELKDDINDEMKTIKDLRNKVDKYEEIIGWMEHEYERNAININQRYPPSTLNMKRLLLRTVLGM